MLAIAHSEGFGQGVLDLSSPEAALTSLYAAWVEADTTHRQIHQRFLDQQIPAGEDITTLTNAQRKALTEHPDQPRQDLPWLAEMAAQVEATWPDHPIVDHARLVQLKALLAYGQVWDGSAVADQLRSIQDPVIAEQAALYVLYASDPLVFPEQELVLDALAEVPTSSDAVRLSLASYSVHYAALLEDWPRTLAWAERLRQTLKACDEPEPDWRLQCDMRAYELRDVSSRLIVLGYLPPQTWQEDLTAQAWRCHLKARHDGISKTVATWTGQRWAFDPWDIPTTTTRCLDAYHAPEIPPATPLRVKLTLEGTP